MSFFFFLTYILLGGVNDKSMASKWSSTSFPF